MLLVTGGAGYIGSHSVINFLNSGYDVLIFDNLEEGHIETVETLKTLGNVKFEKCDLRKYNNLEYVFKKYNIEAVIHFAAFALVGESVKNPAKYYKNNVFGTINLLNVMKKHGVKKLIFSSSCATYGEPEYTPVDELHVQKPINPYGASKLMAERIIKDYDNAYGIKSIILRYFNVAGCDKKLRVGEWHEPETHLIPNIIKSVDGEAFKLFGDDYDTPDGTCIRDYINVEDLAEAHKLAYEYLKKYNTSDVFNLGTEQGSSVKEVFDVCEKVLNRKIKIDIVERRPGDPAALYANIQKAKTILGWKPERTLADSVSTAYNWEQKLKK